MHVQSEVLPSLQQSEIDDKIQINGTSVRQRAVAMVTAVIVILKTDLCNLNKIFNINKGLKEKLDMLHTLIPIWFP
jgi:hypothetical protein